MDEKQFTIETLKKALDYILDCFPPETPDHPAAVPSDDELELIWRIKKTIKLLEE